MVLKPFLSKLAEVQVKHYRLAIVVSLAFTAAMLVGLPDIELQTDLKEELPEGVEVIEIFDKVGTKFGSSESVVIVVQLDQESDVTNRVSDIRSPRVTRMVKQIHQNLEQKRSINSVLSLFSFYPDGRIPGTLRESRIALEKSEQLRGYYSSDYTSTVVYAYSDTGASEAQARELMGEVRESIEGAEKPPGLEILITGSPPMRISLFELLIHDAALTMGGAGAIILLLLLLRCVLDPRHHGLAQNSAEYRYSGGWGYDYRLGRGVRHLHSQEIPGGESQGTQP